jgi:putative ABC transport system permease protein
MWIYRWLVRLAPEALRREYGAAMEEMFARRMADAARSGTWRRTCVYWRELAGLLALAVSERFGAAARMRRQRQRELSGPKAGAMDTMAQELRHAARRLVRTPLFTATAALTLALAIGANASLFTVVYRIVLNPLPYPDSGRLVSMDYGYPSRNIPSGLTSMSWQLYHHLADHARTLEAIAVHASATTTLTERGTPERIWATRATRSLASVLRVSPAIGRWFTEAEEVPGTPPVAVLSHGLWTRRFGADPAIVGKSIALNGVPTEVVGVMPASFTFPDTRVALWTAAKSSKASASFLFENNGVARLREGETIESARTEITALIGDLARVAPNQRGLVSAAVSLQEAIVGRVTSTLWILLASAGLVLLVACANVANLFLVRSESRQREVAVRRALGAGKRTIARYFYSESALLATLGGSVGVMLAWVGVQLLVAAGPPTLPRLNEVRIDGIVLAFSLGLTIIAAVAFGSIPLLRVAPLAATLHDSGRSPTASRRSHRARQLLMGGQVALALILLVASGLMVRSFQKLRAIDPGFDPSSALTFGIGLPDAAYASREAAVDAHRRILERVSALPGVTGASTSSCLPLSGGCFGNMLLVEGEPFDPNRPRPFVSFRAVDGTYTQLMRMRLLRGRALERGDVDRRETNIVITKAAADTYFPGTDPIGRRVRSGVPPGRKLPVAPWMTIVGVVADTKTNALAEPAPVPQLFMPMSIAGGPDIPREALFGPNPTTMNYVVRSDIPPEQLVTAIRGAVDDVDPNLAMAQVTALQDIVDRASDQMSFTMVLLAIAATVALLLGAIGIYGVISYIVAQRTSEIGVRLAMGAEPRTVARMILRQGGLVTLLGIGAGLIAALAGSQLIRSLLYDVSPRDPVVFALTTVALLAIALLACWLPARRASRLSPLEALRTE